jgi:hypothetical protein
MILAKAKIDDYDRFWTVFTSEGAEQRSKYGSKGARVLRNQEDPSEVWVLFDWEKDDYLRFHEDPKTAEIMGRAGLREPPESVFVEAAPGVDA